MRIGLEFARDITTNASCVFNIRQAQFFLRCFYSYSLLSLVFGEKKSMSNGLTDWKLVFQTKPWMSIACAFCADLVSHFGHSYLDFPVIHGKLSSTQYKSFLCIFSILSQGKTAALLANWKALGYETENFHDCIEETTFVQFV